MTPEEKTQRVIELCYAIIDVDKAQAEIKKAAEVVPELNILDHIVNIVHDFLMNIPDFVYWSVSILLLTGLLVTYFLMLKRWYEESGKIDADKTILMTLMFIIGVIVSFGWNMVIFIIIMIIPFAMLISLIILLARWFGRKKFENNKVVKDIIT